MRLYIRMFGVICIIDSSTAYTLEKIMPTKSIHRFKKNTQAEQKNN